MSGRDFSRAPFHIRYSRKSDFEPKFVSIGPHFYKQKDLTTEWDLKDKFTRYFLEMDTAAVKINFRRLVKKLDAPGLEKKIHDWYGGEDKVAPRWKKLLQILVRDSCFIIRIMVYLSREANHMLPLGVNVKMVRFDLLLLENQIPLFFLKKVYDFLHNHNMLPSKPVQSNSLETSPSPSYNRCLSFFPPKNSQQGTASDSQETALSPSHNGCFSFFPPMNSQQPNPEQGRIPQPTLERGPIPQPTSEQSRIAEPTTEQNQSLPHTSEQTDNLVEFLKELKPFICLDMPWQFNDEHISELPDHLLNLYWEWCLPSGLDKNTYSLNHRSNFSDFDTNESWRRIHIRSNAARRIHNASNLRRRAGVTFQKREHKDGFGVDFKNGVLQLTHLQLDERQTALLVNLIAFEDFMRSEHRVLTSYLLLLDGLISTEKDVEILQRYGVITNKLSNIQMASTFFNDIGNVCLVEYRKHYCKDYFEKLQVYYKSKCNRRCAKLRHQYFNSPWATISVMAGTSLLIMAGLQTVYNIYAFYHHHHH